MEGILVCMYVFGRFKQKVWGLVVGDVLCCPVGFVEPRVDIVELVADGAFVRVEDVADLERSVSGFSEGLDFAQLWFVRQYAALIEFECSNLPGVDVAELELCWVLVFSG